MDNGSRDRTAEVARAAGARVVREPRRGYGQACLTGIAAARGRRGRHRVPGRRPQRLPRAAARRASRPSSAARRTWSSARAPAGARRAGSHPWHAVLGHAAVRRAHEPAHRDPRHRPRARSAPSRGRRCAALDMRDRDYGWTVEMQVKARRRGAARGRGAGRLSAAHRAQQGERDGLGHRARGGQDPRHRSPATRSARALTGRSVLGLSRARVLSRLRRGSGRRTRRSDGATSGASWRSTPWPSPPISPRCAPVRRPRPARPAGRVSALAVVWRRGAGRSRRRCCRTTSTATCGRGASSSTAETPTPGRTGPEAERWAPLRDDVWQRRQPQGLHRALSAAVADGGRARSSGCTTPSTAMKAFLVACELRALVAAGGAPAAPRPAARAAAGHGLEPARAGRGRGQRPQRRVRRSCSRWPRWRRWRRAGPLLSAVAGARVPGEAPARARGARVVAAATASGIWRRRRWSRPRWWSRTRTPAPASGAASTRYAALLAVQRDAVRGAAPRSPAATDAAMPRRAVAAPRWSWRRLALAAGRSPPPRR